jgi:hypothetical protein
MPGVAMQVTHMVMMNFNQFQMKSVIQGIYKKRSIYAIYSFLIYFHCLEMDGEVLANFILFSLLNLVDFSVYI